MRFTKIAVVSVLAVGVAVGAMTVAAPQRRAAQRSFRFVYTAEIANIPQGARNVAVWVPYPVTDLHQTIREVDVKAPVPTTIEKDAAGNAARGDLAPERGEIYDRFRRRLMFPIWNERGKTWEFAPSIR